jgi:hypothetical protein
MGVNGHTPDDSDTLKRALLAIRKMRASLDALEKARTAPVAVVGMGCRFPGGADGPAALWKILREGTDTVSEVPEDRWEAQAYYDPDPEAPGKMITRSGASGSGS